MKNPNHIAFPETDPTSNILTVVDAADHRRRQQERVMNNFRAAIMEVARTDPVRPLTADRKMVIEKRISEFFPEFRTPDHPPYAAMIYRAIEELNEEGGSSEDSISKFIRKEYSDLPWAHSKLLRHHLGKLCESGDIVLTSDKSYIRIAVTAPPNSGPLPCPKKKKIKRKRKREKEHSRGRTNQRKKNKIEEQNQLEEGEIEVIGGKNQQIEEHVEVIEELNEVQEQDEVIREHTQVEKDENEMVGFELKHQENVQIESKEREQENGETELLSPEGPPGCDLATVEKLPKSQEQNIQLPNHKKPPDLEQCVEQNLIFSKPMTKTTFIDVPVDSQPFEPETNPEEPPELSSLQERPELQPEEPPDLLAVSQQFGLEQKLELPNSEASLDPCFLQELLESLPVTTVVFPLSTTASSNTPVVSHLVEQLQQPEILNSVGPQELCAQKKLPGPGLPNPEKPQDAEVGAVEEVGELSCTLQQMQAEQKRLRRQSKRFSKSTPKFEQQPGLSNLEVLREVESTTAEVSCEAQHQQEKFHGERETSESLLERVTESVDLPMKIEQQPELSDLEKTTKIELSIIEQSSQTERMQRQLKRWSREKSQHPMSTVELSPSLQNQHQKQPELQNRETESSQEVPGEQQEKLHGQENMISSNSLYCESEQVGPEQHAELSSSDRVHELETQHREKPQPRELWPRPLKPGPEIRGPGAPPKPKSDIGTTVGVVLSLNQQNETELLEPMKNPPGDAEFREQKQLVHSPESSSGIELMEEFSTRDPKVSQALEKPQCRELRSGPRKVEKQQPERRGRGRPPKQKSDTATTEGIFLPLNHQNETELQQPMKNPSEDGESDDICALREQKQLVHTSETSSGIDLMEEMSTQDPNLIQAQEKPHCRILRSCPPKVEKQQPERRGRGRPPKAKSDTGTTVGTLLSRDHQNETELQQTMKNPEENAELYDICALREQKQLVHSPESSLGIELMEELSTQDPKLIQVQERRKLRSCPPKVEKQQPERRGRGRPPKPKSDTDKTGNETELQQPMKNPSGEAELYDIYALREQNQPVHSPESSSGIELMEELSTLDPKLIQAQEKPQCRELRSRPSKIEKQQQPEHRGRGRPPKPESDTDTTVGTSLSLNHQSETELHQPVKNPSGEAELFYSCDLREQNQLVQSPKRPSEIELMEELSTQDQMSIQAPGNSQCRKLRSRPPKVEKQQPERRGQRRPPKPNSDTDTTMKDPIGDGEKKQSVHSPERSPGIVVMEELSNPQKPESRKLRSFPPKVEKHQPERRCRGRHPKLKTDTDTTVGAFSSLILQNEHEQQLDLQNPERSSGIESMEELSTQELQRQQAEEKPRCRKRKLWPSKIELQSESRGHVRRPKPETDTTTNTNISSSDNEHNSQNHVHKEEKAKRQGRGRPPKTKAGDGVSMENLLAPENQQPPPKSRGRGRPRKLE